MIAKRGPIEIDCEQLSAITKKTHISQQSHPGQLTKFIKDPQMIKALHSKKIMKLFPCQYKCYDFILKGEDVMVRDRTGSGKTLAFSLPIMDRLRKSCKFTQGRSPKFLIVIPTRELAIQIHQQISSLLKDDQKDIKIIAVYGQSDIKIQINTLNKGIDIVVATPGRLGDLLDRKVLKMNQLQTVCLDEADQILNQGFQKQIQKLFKYIQENAPGKTQNLLFSATIPQWVEQISLKYQAASYKFFDLIETSQVKTSTTVQHICLSYGYKEGKQAKIINALIKQYTGTNGRILIFCQTKKDVSNLVSLIQKNAEQLHGDIPQSKRQNVFKKFKSGKLNCLIATNVASRGLDFPQIDLIIQCQPPKNTDQYIHRSGRTGRAGKKGLCITLYTKKKQHLIDQFQQEAKITMKRLQQSDIDLSHCNGRSNNYNNNNNDNNNNKNYNNNYNNDYSINDNNNNGYNSRNDNNYNGNTNYYQKRQNQYNNNDYQSNYNKDRNSCQNNNNNYSNNYESKYSKNNNYNNNNDNNDNDYNNNNNYNNSKNKNYSGRNNYRNNNNQDRNRNNDNNNNNGYKKKIQVFVGSLPREMNRQQLMSFFNEQEGVQITNIKLPQNPQGQLKGYGFLTCASQSSRQKALELNGTNLKGRNITVSLPKIT